MLHLETITGQGTMTSNSGEEVTVNYELHVYQDEIHAGTLENPSATIPGMKEIRGTVNALQFPNLLEEHAAMLAQQRQRIAG